MEMEKIREDMVNEFRAVTGVDDVRAMFYLEATGWDLKLAAQTYFDDPAPDDDDLYAPRDVPPADGRSVPFASAPFACAATPKKDPLPIQRKVPLVQKPAAQYAKPTGAKPKVTTLASLITLEDDDELDPDESEAFYAGGSERSGQQILGPPTKNPAADIAKNLFKAAEGQGAEPAAGRPRAAKRTFFKGPGHVLGTQEVVGASAAAAAASPPTEYVVTVWRNGFVINNGPLRDFNLDENSQFLTAIQSGKVPTELSKQTGGKDVEVHLVDKSDAMFVPPSKPTVVPFAGAGYRLGSPAAAGGPNLKKTGGFDYDAARGDAQAMLKVDESRPTTSVQVRLTDETRLGFTVNMDHTIADIRRAIEIARPEYANTSHWPYSLLTLFPTRELSDDTTIEAGGLLNSVILQRMRS